MHCLFYTACIFWLPLREVPQLSEIMKHSADTACFQRWVGHNHCSLQVLLRPAIFCNLLQSLLLRRGRLCSRPKRDSVVGSQRRDELLHAALEEALRQPGHGRAAHLLWRGHWPDVWHQRPAALQPAVDHLRLDDFTRLSDYDSREKRRTVFYFHAFVCRLRKHLSCHLHAFCRTECTFEPFFDSQLG
jgi:hypothetical protein